jgi:hypothetical protein
MKSVGGCSFHNWENKIRPMPKVKQTGTANNISMDGKVWSARVCEVRKREREEGEDVWGEW